MLGFYPRARQIKPLGEHELGSAYMVATSSRKIPFHKENRLNSILAPSILAPSISALSILALGLLALSILALGLLAPSILALGLLAPSILALRLLALSILALNVNWHLIVIKA